MIGQRIPDITFKTRVKDEEGNYGWKDVTTCDYFKGKSVICLIYTSDADDE